MQQLWMLKLRPDETSCSLLLEQNDSLRRQVRTLQQQNSSLEQQVDTWQSQNTALHMSIHQQGHSLPAPPNPISEYSRSYQRKLKRKRTESCEASLQWLKDHSLLPTQVTVRHLDSGETETIDIGYNEAVDLFGEDYKEDESDFDQVNMMLFIKDSYNVSGNAYHEFARITKEMPRHYRLKKRISELNSLWKIVPTPDGSGIQQSLEDRLRDRLAQYHS